MPARFSLEIINTFVYNPPIGLGERHMSPHYGKFIAYFRVSTNRQGKSGLGLDAQREAVMNYLDGGRWTLIGEFTEVESGRRSDRPELEKALAACKRQKAKLVIAPGSSAAPRPQYPRSRARIAVSACSFNHPRLFSTSCSCDLRFSLTSPQAADGKRPARR